MNRNENNRAVALLVKWFIIVAFFGVGGEARNGHLTTHGLIFATIGGFLLLGGAFHAARFNVSLYYFTVYGCIASWGFAYDHLSLVCTRLVLAGASEARWYLEIAETSIAMLLAGFACRYVALFRRKWSRFLRYPVGHCQTCGYDLTGNVSGRCSECGKEIDENHSASDTTDSFDLDRFDSPS